jgi:hypothetical protein
VSTEAKAGGGVRAWAGVALVVLVAFGVAWALQLRRDAQYHEQVQALRSLTQSGGLQMLSRSDCAECERSRKWFESEQIRLEVCLLDGPGACAQAYAADAPKRLPVFVVHGKTQIKTWDLAELKKALETQP